MNNPITDSILMIVLIINTIILLFIEFDRKIFLRLIFNHHFFVIFCLTILEIVVVFILMINVKG